MLCNVHGRVTFAHPCTLCAYLDILHPEYRIAAAHCLSLARGESAISVAYTGCVLRDPFLLLALPEDPPVLRLLQLMGRSEDLWVLLPRRRLTNMTGKYIHDGFTLRETYLCLSSTPRSGSHELWGNSFIGTTDFYMTVLSGCSAAAGPR